MHDKGDFYSAERLALARESRPKELPFLEGEHDMRPSEYHDLMSQPPMQEPDLFDPQDWTPD